VVGPEPKSRHSSSMERSKSKNTQGTRQGTTSSSVINLLRNFWPNDNRTSTMKIRKEGQQRKNQRVVKSLLPTGMSIVGTGRMGGVKAGIPCDFRAKPADPGKIACLPKKFFPTEHKKKKKPEHRRKPGTAINHPTPGFPTSGEEAGPKEASPPEKLDSDSFRREDIQRKTVSQGERDAGERARGRFTRKNVSM